MEQTRSEQIPLDPALGQASERARVALRALVPAEQIGQGHRVQAEEELLVTHRFECLRPGYHGWEWYVTLARQADSEVPTVCESGLLPGQDALLAPAWVPWSDRLHDDERASGAERGSAEADAAAQTAEQDRAEQDDQDDDAPAAAQRPDGRSVEEPEPAAAPEAPEAADQERSARD